ncbi:hypothetical protein [Sphingomonas jatrophae]|uniref:Bbp19-like phage domain-containing protein n=1 Tax=Sphingomonas jatrophae TaxID=1166337 RepID=A0A1I6K5R8_9SPHN|nr:hypothetical protein [Sphingomonas jatrophae]SFR86546.1 hypothetical protein SAMN05192580_1355 [Sphingomonas jatrophae]
MSAAQINALRVRSVKISRAFKALFKGGVPVSRFYRWLFHVDGELRRDGQIVLADLRDFCFADRPTFDSDALVMARREGRRDVFLRITNYLNLDESVVRQLMEIDDGI